MWHSFLSLARQYYLSENLSKSNHRKCLNRLVQVPAQIIDCKTDRVIDQSILNCNQNHEVLDSFL